MAPSRGQDSGQVIPDCSMSNTAASSDAVISASNLAAEPPAFARSRAYIVLSFWIIIAALGLPLWWHTTSIVRAPLPASEMQAWAEGRVCKPLYPLQILFDAPSLTSSESKQLRQSVQSALDHLIHSSSHLVQLYSRDRLPSTPYDLAVVLEPSRESADSRNSAIEPHTLKLTIPYEAKIMSESLAANDTVDAADSIARSIYAIFEEEEALLTSTHGKSAQARDDVKLIQKLERRRTRSAKFAPVYHLTFSLLTQSEGPKGWEIEQALDRHLSPVIKLLSSLSHFDIDTQVQSYSQLSQSVVPRYNDAAQTWVLDRDDLGSFINAAEWPLTPSIGAAPTINFILYVPDVDRSPLSIGGANHDSSSNSWLVPQWGGISILNRLTHKSTDQQDPTISVDELETPMLEFASHLLALLGLPSQPERSLPLQLNSLRRTLVWTLMSSSSATLGALARLTDSLPSIAVPASVAAAVRSAVTHLDASCTAMRAGDFSKAFDEAKGAEAQAEKAFFEPSMVGQVYFPDEHKVAVYLPLLGPIAVPLVLGAVTELKGLKKLLRPR